MIFGRKHNHDYYSEKFKTVIFKTVHSRTTIDELNALNKFYFVYDIW
jgi:hypothetical protein